MQFVCEILNNHRNHIEQSALHFKRWSNTSYAVFNSIGKVVHIGKLSQIIHGLVTVKSVLQHEFLKLFYSIDQNEVHDEDLLGQLEISNSLELVQLPVNFIVNPSIDCSGDLYFVNYYFSSLLSRPFKGLFYFVGAPSFMGIPAFFMSINTQVKN